MSPTVLWWGVVLAGLFHGLNPGMGWPLAVSAALMERRGTALPRAVGALAAGHFLAMAAVLLPFSMLSALAARAAAIRLVAGLVVLAVGVFLLITKRHPRFLARVPPSRLALWSFLAATAHGAGLMLVPLLLAMDGEHAGHTSTVGGVAAAGAVALVHTAAMAAAGGGMAVVVHRWLGLRAVTRTWFNLDLLWALSLVLVGGFGIWSALAGA